eukprot:SM000021S06405  [mRNA]  locus=s21:2510:6161:- [translate_table: standard]
MDGLMDEPLRRPSLVRRMLGGVASSRRTRCVRRPADQPAVAAAAIASGPAWVEFPLVAALSSSRSASFDAGASGGDAGEHGASFAKYVAEVMSPEGASFATAGGGNKAAVAAAPGVDDGSPLRVGGGHPYRRSRQYRYFKRVTTAASGGGSMDTDASFTTTSSGGSGGASPVSAASRATSPGSSFSSLSPPPAATKPLSHGGSGLPNNVAVKANVGRHIAAAGTVVPPATRALHLLASVSSPPQPEDTAALPPSFFPVPAMTAVPAAFSTRPNPFFMRPAALDLRFVSDDISSCPFAFTAVAADDAGEAQAKARTPPRARTPKKPDVELPPQPPMQFPPRMTLLSPTSHPATGAAATMDEADDEDEGFYTAAQFYADQGSGSTAGSPSAKRSRRGRTWAPSPKEPRIPAKQPLQALAVPMLSPARGLALPCALFACPADAARPRSRPPARLLRQVSLRRQAPRCAPPVTKATATAESCAYHHAAAWPAGRQDRLQEQLPPPSAPALELTYPKPGQSDGGGDGKQEPSLGPYEAVVARLICGGPEAHVEAVKDVQQMAQDSEARNELRAAGAVPALVALLRSPACRGHAEEAVIMALLNLAISSHANKHAIVEAGGIPKLVDVLQPRFAPSAAEVAVQEAAAALVLSLAASNQLKPVLGHAGAIPPLVSMLTAGSSAHGMLDAVWALLNLSFHGPNKSLIVTAGGVSPLLATVSGAQPEIQEKAIAVIAQLSTVAEGRAALCAEAIVIPALIGVLDEGTNVSKEHAANVLLRICSTNEVLRRAAVMERVIPVAVELSLLGTDKVRVKAQKLLSFFQMQRAQETSVKTFTPDVAESQMASKMSLTTVRPRSLGNAWDSPSRSHMAHWQLKAQRIKASLTDGQPQLSRVSLFLRGLRSVIVGCTRPAALPTPRTPSHGDKSLVLTYPESTQIVRPACRNVYPGAHVNNVCQRPQRNERQLPVSIFH